MYGRVIHTLETFRIRPESYPVERLYGAPLGTHKAYVFSYEMCSITWLFCTGKYFAKDKGHVRGKN